MKTQKPIRIIVQVQSGCVVDVRASHPVNLSVADADCREDEEQDQRYQRLIAEMGKLPEEIAT